MTLQISQGIIKGAVTVSGDVRVSQGVVKVAANSAGGSLRVSQGLVKMAVRTYQVHRVPRLPPPNRTTYARAPYTRENRG